MITIEEIKKTIYEKIKPQVDFDCPSEEDFNKQLSEIKRNYKTALEETKAFFGDEELDKYYKNDMYSVVMDEIENYFKEIYKRTTWIETRQWWSDSPFNFCLISFSKQELIDESYPKKNRYIYESSDIEQRS